MDCYFRQYWNDKRLGFPPLDLSAHGSQIDQLSLNVKMLEKIWKVSKCNNHKSFYNFFINYTTYLDFELHLNIYLYIIA